MGIYINDRSWSDQYINAIRQIVGPLLLVESSFDVDTQQVADLVVMKARDMTVAARVRRHGYADRYPCEFTVRSARDNGAKTEMAKLIEGWGDWMFYGHAGEKAGEIIRWMVIDLNLWRAALLRAGFNGAWQKLCEHKSNGDGTHFFAFDVRQFSPSILIASNFSLNEERAAA